MSFLHASAPRAVAPGAAASNGARAGVRVIESSVSRAAAAPKTRYRDPMLEAMEAETTYVQPNIMFDPRVQRGTTSGKIAVLASTLKAEQMGATLPRDGASITPAASAAAAGRASKAALVSAGLVRPSHPSVAYIHNHITVVKKRVEVPLHLYLVEQKEETLVHDCDTQCDAMMAEPPLPAYVPRKTGIDAGSQVDTNMVFSFDADVAPLLEVVVSKTLEQALMEVREEEGLAEIEDHRQALEAKFLSEEDRAEERLKEERRLHAAKEAMLAAARVRAGHVASIRARLAAGHVARHYLGSIVADVMQDLTTAGLFHHADSLSHRVEREYMPSLVSGVDLSLARTTGARVLVDEVLAQALEKQQATTRQVLAAKARAEAERVAAEKAAQDAADELARRQRKIQLFIHSTAVPAEQSPVGPINLTGLSTIQDVEHKVYAWMQENLEGSEDGVPERAWLKFLWNGVELQKDASTCVYDLGIQSLATLTMELNKPAPPPEPVKEKNSDDEDEDADATEEEATNTQDEEEDV